MLRETEHRRFLRQVATFFSLPAIGLAIFEVAYFRIGENWPAERVVEAQQRDPEILYQRQRFAQQFPCYKLAAVRMRKPSIFVFGSSRVMKFRSELFGDEAAQAYNLGGLGSLAHVAMILDRLPSPPVRLLVGVDPWWFNRRYAETQRPAAAELDEAAWSWQAHLEAIRTSARLDRGEILGWLVNPDPNYLGVMAQRRHFGFRFDGSLQDDLPVPTTDEGWKFVDREVPPIVERVRTSTRQFVPADGVDPEQVAALRELLERLNRDGAAVVGFFPPMSEEVDAEIDKHDGPARFRRQVGEVVPQAFAEFGFPFFDFSTTETFGVDDTYLTDGIHPGETCTARMFHRMLLDPRVKAMFPQAEEPLRRALASPRTNRRNLDFPPQ